MNFWSELSWWDLPGPSRFVRDVTRAVESAADGVTGLLLPRLMRPSGLIGAIKGNLDQATGSEAVVVNLGNQRPERPPSSILAAAVQVDPGRIRLVSNFVTEAQLAETIFIVHGLTAEQWPTWQIFLHRVQEERLRLDRMLAPRFLIVAPPGVAGPDWKEVVKRDFKWLGRASRLDTQLYVERLLGWPDDALFSRIAVSVITELTGYDPQIAHKLADIDLERLLGPSSLHECLEDVGDIYPCWENGLVDHWDGHVWVHSCALHHADYSYQLKARIWRGLVRVVFPFLHQVRQAFVSKYEAVLRAHPPIVKTYNTRRKEYDDPWEIEFFDIRSILRGAIDQTEGDLLWLCNAIRGAIAHVDLPKVQYLLRASELWEELEPHFPDGCHGWDWPRTGQKMIIMVGPSGAGKTTWAQKHHASDEILSSDDIRQELYGDSGVAGDQTPVFDELRKRTLEKLARGRNVVIDATNIRREDRLKNTRLAPPDVQVTYVVIDRPLEDKRATAGWRLERGDMLETHTSIFQENLEAILQGDGHRNVVVWDRRQQEVRSCQADELSSSTAGARPGLR